MQRCWCSGRRSGPWALSSGGSEGAIVERRRWDLSAALSLDAARELADEVLFPTANEVDSRPVLPRERLDVLADRGWYGLSAPSSGFDIVSARPVVEAFAGACLTTTFVWMQHLGTPPACAFGPEHLRPWVDRLASGARRSTVAFAGLLPDPPLRARLDDGGWILDGVAPWVSGWGLSDVVHVAARTPEDDVVWLLVEAPSAGMSSQPLRLLAVNASATVTLSFTAVRVGADRETSRFPWATGRLVTRWASGRTARAPWASPGGAAG